VIHVKPGFHLNARKTLRKEKYAGKIKSAQETQQTQENYASKNKSMQAQVTQLTQAVLAQENAMIESILFFTQRTHRMHLRCVRLNGNRALVVISISLSVVLALEWRWIQMCWPCSTTDVGVLAFTSFLCHFPLSNDVLLWVSLQNINFDASCWILNWTVNIFDPTVGDGSGLYKCWIQDVALGWH